MRVAVLFTAVLILPFFCMAQIDTLKSSKKTTLFENKLGPKSNFELPPLPKNNFGKPNLVPNSNSGNPFPFKLPQLSVMPPKDNNTMFKETFANNGERFEKALNKKDKPVGPGYKSDQYLGDFKTTAKRITIVCRDYEFVDGDRVRVLWNDEVIENNIHLIQQYQAIEIDLDEGFNRIDFEALNQGSSGPNTAEFKVFDEQGKLLSANQWNLTTGIKATLIVIRQ